MPFERPTLAQLVARARADLESRMAGTDAHLRRTYEDAVAVIQGGQAHGLHGHLVWLSQQIIPDTAEEEFMVRWASIFGVNRLDATAAQGPILLTGTDTTVCPAGTQWRRSDGVVYDVDADATISGESVVAQVTATDDHLGSNGNSLAGQSLQIVSPIAGIDSTAVVQAPGILNGANRETLESLLERLLLRIQKPPKGGGPGDYERWAREVAGVTRAWELPAYNGLGTVGLTFLTDGEVDPIPNAGKVDEVQAYIDTKAPITAAVNVFAPTAVVQPIVLSTLTPNSAAVQAAVTAELTDLWLRKAQPGGTIYLSQIREAISIAVGEENHVLTTPSADVSVDAGEISVLGTITFP